MDRSSQPTSYRFVRKIEIDGHPYLARIVIDSNNHGNRYYNHELSDVRALTENPQAPLQPGGHHDGGELGNEALEDTGKILRWIYGVKEEDSSSPPSDLDHTAFSLGHGAQIPKLSSRQEKDVRAEALKMAKEKGSINVDDIRPLIPGYHEADPLTRDNLYHPAAAKIYPRVLEQLLQEPTTTGNVLVLAGGGGSGKSSISDSFTPETDFTIDTTLSTPGSAEKLRQKIEDSGRKMAVLYVHRIFPKAFELILDRYIRERKESGAGRIVPLKAAVEAHLGAQNEILGLQGADIMVVDNNRGPNQHHKISLEELRKQRYYDPHESEATSSSDGATERGPADETRQSGIREDRTGISGDSANQGRAEAAARLEEEGRGILSQWQADGLLNQQEVSAFLAGLEEKPKENAEAADHKLASAQEKTDIGRSTSFSLGRAPQVSPELAATRQRLTEEARKPGWYRNLTPHKLADHFLNFIGLEQLRETQPRAPLSKKIEAITQFAQSLQPPRIVLKDSLEGIAMPSLDGPSSNLAKEYGIRANVIAERFVKDLAVNLKCDFVGENVQSLDHLASKAQALRNPLFESFYVLAMKKTSAGMEVVGALPLSARIPCSVSPFIGHVSIEEGIQQHLTFLKNAGADFFAYIHNHPSGDPSPSEADIELTRTLASEIQKEGFGFHSHIVINHQKYCAINADGTLTHGLIHDKAIIKDLDRSAPDPYPWPQNQLIGADVEKTGIVNIAKKLQLSKEHPDHLLGIITTVGGDICSVLHGDADHFLSLTRENLQDYVRTQGGSYLILYAESASSGETEGLLKKIAPMAEKHLLFEMIINEPGDIKFVNEKKLLTIDQVKSRFFGGKGAAAKLIK